MRVKISIFLTLFFSLTFGQGFHNDSIINNFVKNLTDSRVDTILVYENGCVGCGLFFGIVLNDSCFYFGEPQISYIMWKINGLTYISKISDCDCYVYDTILYDFNLVWDFYFNHKSKIKTEQIKMPMYIDKGGTHSVDIDHYSYYQILLIDIESKIVYEINDYYLTKTVGEKHVNLNYQRNYKTFRKQLQLKIDNEIKNIEEKKLIKTAYNTVYKQWQPIK